MGSPRVGSNPTGVGRSSRDTVGYRAGFRSLLQEAAALLSELDSCSCPLKPGREQPCQVPLVGSADPPALQDAVGDGLWAMGCIPLLQLHSSHALQFLCIRQIVFYYSHAFQFLCIRRMVSVT